MARLLLAFGFAQAAAAAAFLWLLPAQTARRPEEFAAWVAASAGWFWVLAWPLLDARRAGTEPRAPAAHAVEVAGDAGVLALALAPWLVAARVLALSPWPILARAAAPALGMLAAASLVCWSARVGGPRFRRFAVAAALAGLAFGPLAWFLSGAAGSFPSDPVTLLSRPWLSTAALAFPAAAFVARRLGSGAVAEDRG